MNPIPTKAKNPKGLHRRYIVQKTDGTAVDPKAEYFVLRLDWGGKDANHVYACRFGVHAYAAAIEPFIPELAKDLRRRYPFENKRFPGKLANEIIRAKALEMFGVVHGKGDAGSEHEFCCLNPAVKAGWLELAWQVLRGGK